MMKRVLIIEDDEDTQLGLSIRFRASGLATLLSVDGPGGLMTAQRERPDLIVLDLGLPGGDGFIVLERLKSNAKTEHIPVIVLSARDPAVNRPRALELRAEAYFQKPAEPADLLAEIRRHIGEAPPKAARAKTRKVLIIEDDADTRRALGVRLRSAGYEIGFAADGMSAMTAASREKPDAILLDLGLPAGDGFTVLDRLRRNPSFCTIPVIVLSGREAELIADQVHGLGARAYIQKPVDSDALLSTLEKVVDGETVFV